MKQIALIISLFVSLTINGQQINQPANHYRNGDMLEKKPSWDYLLDFF